MTGRRIAVLGGAGGIGRAVVDRLVKSGERVLTLDTSAALGRYPPRVQALEIDLRDEASIAAARDAVGESFQGLEGMVCISGILGRKQHLRDLDIAEFDRIMSVNLRGILLAAKAFLPLLEKGDEPSLVLMGSSIVGRPLPSYGAYTLSKSALGALTRQLALEAAPHLRVNAVGPGIVATAFSRGGTGSDESGTPTDYGPLIDHIPLRRVGTPEDVAGPIAFLLGHDSRYITGQVLWITGGLYMP